MKKLLVALYDGIHELREKLGHQHRVLDRQVSAIERLTDPAISFSKNVLKPMPPPHGKQLKATEEAILVFLEQKKEKADAKSMLTGEPPLSPSNSKLSFFTDLILQSHEKYTHQRPRKVIDWRNSVLVGVMEDVIGPIPETGAAAGGHGAPDWVRVPDDEYKKITHSIKALRAFEHPLASSGSSNEGFLASFLREVALQQTGFKSFRSRLLLSKEEWKDMIKCLSAEVAESVLGLYTIVEEALDSALTLDLSQEERMRIIRMAADAISLNLRLTRNLDPQSWKN